MTATLARRRAGILLAVLLLSMLVLTLRLGYVQGVRSEEYAGLAEQQRLRQIELPAPRGSIYDRHGRDLAMSIPARTVYANPRQIADPDGTARVLAPILAQPPEVLVERLRQDRGFVYLARRVDVEVGRQIEELELIGVSVMDEPRRAYPGGSLAANVLGFVGTDAEGLAGIESAYDRLLGGRPGYRTLEQDPRGRQIPQGVFQEEPPIPGSDIMLTIDRDLQHAAEQALDHAIASTGAIGGTVVAASPRTGEILAMVSRPTFDPNNVAGIDPETMRNRTVADTYEPGSVSKLVVAAGALEEQLFAPDTPIHVPARIHVGGADFTDAHPQPTRSIPFDQVIAQSSNVGTIQIALELGADRLERYLARFGYGRGTGSGFPGEEAGTVPSASQWGTSLPTMAIGQGLSASPLQLVLAYSAVANDGVRVEPKLVGGWIDPDGELHRTPSPRGRRAVSEGTARAMRQILAKAVEEGTGTLAQIPGYTVGGKTGTAQKAAPGGYQGHMASFVGLVPVEQPELVIGVILDEPTPIWGGVVAAPVFREVAETGVRILRIPPERMDPIPQAAHGDTGEGSLAVEPGPGVLR